MLDKVLASSLGDAHKKLYAHYDYFGYIIPAVWFLVGVLVVEFRLCADSPVVQTLDEAAAFLGQVAGIDSLAFELVLAVIILLLLFNLAYITGHLLNGASALLVDRTVVKKLLKYPFRLWLLREDLRRSRRGRAIPDDHAIFASAVMDSSYGLTAFSNLAPWVLLEIGFVLYGARPNHSEIYWAYTPVGCFGLAAALVYLHFGWPASRAERLDLENEFGSFVRYRRAHKVLLPITTLSLALLLYLSGTLYTLLLLPLASLVVAYGDRTLRQDEEYSTPSAKKLYFYLRSCFPNWIYFVANLVDYGSMPSRAVLQRAGACAGKLEHSASDFFWLSYINLENRAPASFPAAYHFLSMYGMNRNLSAATGFILLYTGLAYFCDRIAVSDGAVFLWVCSLLVFALLFFVRFLYLYSGYYSKYIVRAAAFLEKAGRES